MRKAIVLFALPVDVVLTLRDDKGAIHWLAVRHQRIAAVE